MEMLENIVIIINAEYFTIYSKNIWTVFGTYSINYLHLM